MKRVLILLVILIVTACESDSNHPFAGTSWSKSYHSSYNGEDYMYVIEFTKDEFMFYEADINGGYKSGMTQGRYTFSNNEIFINNVHDLTDGITDKYITGATISGNILTLHRYAIHSNGDISYYWDLTLMRRN